MRWPSSDTGWQRLVGSVNCKVSFATEPYFCKALLQKRPDIEGACELLPPHSSKTLEFRIVIVFTMLSIIKNMSNIA